MKRIVELKIEGHEPILDFACKKTYLCADLVRGIHKLTAQPIFLPTKVKKWTVNRDVFVHKRSRESFEQRTHRRLLLVEADTPTLGRQFAKFVSQHLPAHVLVSVKEFTFEALSRYYNLPGKYQFVDQVTERPPTQFTTKQIRQHLDLQNAVRPWTPTELEVLKSDKPVSFWYCQWTKENEDDFLEVKMDWVPFGGTVVSVKEDHAFILNHLGVRPYSAAHVLGLCAFGDDPSLLPKDFATYLEKVKKLRQKMKELAQPFVEKMSQGYALTPEEALEMQRQKRAYQYLNLPGMPEHSRDSLYHALDVSGPFTEAALGEKWEKDSAVWDNLKRIAQDIHARHDEPIRQVEAAHAEEALPKAPKPTQ